MSVTLPIPCCQEIGQFLLNHDREICAMESFIFENVYKSGMPSCKQAIWNRTGVGVTEAPFANFSVSKIFDLEKLPVRFPESHSYLTGVTAANVIFNS